MYGKSWEELGEKIGLMFSLRLSGGEKKRVVGNHWEILTVSFFFLHGLLKFNLKGEMKQFFPSFPFSVYGYGGIISGIHKCVESVG